MKKVSIIVPCYNEEETLLILYKALCEVSKEINDYQLEFLFVNDGSKDKTLDILNDLSKNDERVKYISFSRNFGKESAMLAGFKNAHGDLITIMDADMQDPPSLLPKMIEIIETEDYDSVATRRVSRKGEPKIRSFFARKFYKIINRISDADVVDGARDFRLMKKEMVEAIIEINEYNRFSKGIFGWIGYKTYWLPYENIERVAGETKWSFWKLFKYSIDGIINFSQAPLVISSWMGIIFTFISFIMIIVIIVRKLAFGDPVAGWASLVCIITFIGGVILFCLGIMGQYISKTYLESKKRPHYIVKDTNIDDMKKVG